MDAQFRELVGRLPVVWLANYVRSFEAGRVQKHPQARFVNAKGECCLVGALAGVSAAADLVGTELWPSFVGGELERLSRAFEGGRLTGQQVYEEALLALAARSAAVEAGSAVAAVGV